MMNITINKNNSLPIYTQISDQLKDYIIKHKLTPDTSLPSVYKIADAAGVSLRTADLALKKLIDDGICYRRPKKGTFVAKNLKTDVKKLCGVFSTHNLDDILKNILATQMYSGILETAAGFNMNASVILDDAERSISLYDSSANFDLCGFAILNPCSLKEITSLAKKFPDKFFVYLNYLLKGFENTPDNVFAVINDDFGGAYNLCKHYISKGSNSVAILTTPLPHDDLTYTERVKGIMSAVKDYGLNTNTSRDILNIANDDNSREGYRQAAYLEVKKYLNSVRQPDVFLCVNDYMAAGAEKCIEDNGLTAKVQIGGYDNLTKEFYVNRSFNSVKVNYAEMGRTSIKLLNSAGKNYTKVTRIMPDLDLNN